MGWMKLGFQISIFQKISMENDKNSKYFEEQLLRH